MTEKFGKYVVLRQIGSGGFGSVFEARDPVIERAVAIKTCHVQDEEVRARFLQEARLAGNLHHRNLTTIYDIGAEGEVLYLICEFLPGEDLDAFIERKDLSLVEKVEILIGVAYGLAHAHDQGVIHRDIKPSNIRILPDQTVKIMDFGIAKSMYAERTLTRAGRTLGTAAYLAPEQIRGEPVDRRTDVFSFGVLAYELLSSRKPFAGANPAAVLDSIARRQAPSLAEESPDVPGPLAQIVEKAMRNSPADRYPSMDPIRRDLIAVREELLGSAPVPAARRGDREILQEPGEERLASSPQRNWPVRTAILVALGVAGALLLRWWLTHGGR
ncbi:MAG TPA: serine/threonine-protein kinase [Thermoanaerobaculia bacterium]